MTSSVQPLDVRINKQFKDRIREQWNEWMPGMILTQTAVKSFKCGISNSLDGIKDDYLWQDEEAEAESTPSNTEFDPYDDCLADVSQDVIDELMISDDEQEDFEGF
ncbi:unnamed protein product [Protopolystoma xenopodis]|uniref:Uncharacterized protein n=1 Tax=Protopolystoma xenopodis TaxID=117903 RepID=A0A3S5CLH8_9PLAT|nr:unnamed protein product [Protopolystoma xenopodis]